MAGPGPGAGRGLAEGWPAGPGRARPVPPHCPAALCSHSTPLHPYASPWNDTESLWKARLWPVYSSASAVFVLVSLSHSLSLSVCPLSSGSVANIGREGERGVAYPSIPPYPCGAYGPPLSLFLSLPHSLTPSLPPACHMEQHVFGGGSERDNISGCRVKKEVQRSHLM